YLKREGVECPVCRTTDRVCTDSVTAEGLTGTQGVRCDNCGSSWKNEYILTGFSNLEEGEITSWFDGKCHKCGSTNLLRDVKEVSEDRQEVIINWQCGDCGDVQDALYRNPLQVPPNH